jgi:hypothetical protein
MLWPRGRHLVYSSISFPGLSIILPSFLHNTSYVTWTTHPSIVGVFRCVCTHPIDLMGIHLLRCVHGNKRIGTHDVICDTFVTIAWDVGFHVGWEQVHVLLSTTFNSSCQWVNIVFTKDGIRTLADVVISNPTQAYLFLWFCATQGFATLDVTQAKERSYCNWHFIH